MGFCNETEAKQGAKPCGRWQWLSLSLPKTGTPSNRDPFLMRTDVYQIAARAQPAQNGLTITRMTIAIISSVGISLTMRQWRGGLSFLSSLNARTEAEK